MKTQVHTKRTATRALPAALIAAALLAAAPAAADEEFTRDFRLEDCSWSNRGPQNPFFSLRPGRQLVLEGEEDGTTIRAELTVLTEVETIRFRTARGELIRVRTRVLEERETEDGELVEVSRNWVARCVETGNIVYFGEEVDNYEDGEIVDHDGSWRAGEGGALPGVLMPGSFLLGARYYQEIAPGVAEDRAENVRMGLTVTVPAGTFHGCVEVEESDALSPDDSGDVKVYCPRVGLVRDESLELVEVGVVP